MDEELKKSLFTTYSIAKHLKKLGYNESFFAEIDEKESIKFRDGFYITNDPIVIPAILWQQAIDFLRKQYGIHIHIELYEPGFADDELVWSGDIVFDGATDDNSSARYKTYEEARICAIYEAIEHLIKIQEENTFELDELVWLVYVDGTVDIVKYRHDLDVRNHTQYIITKFTNPPKEFSDLYNITKK